MKCIVVLYFLVAVAKATPLSKNDQPVYKIAYIQPQPEEPPQSKTSDLPNEVEREEEFQGRVFYNGSQVWKAMVENQDKIRVLVELRDEQGRFFKTIQCSSPNLGQFYSHFNVGRK